MGNHPSSSDGGGGGGGGGGVGHHHNHHNHHNHHQNQQQASRSGQHHRDHSNGGGIRHLLRNNGALGLSKAELEARCQPSGLYQSCNWEYKQIRRLIGDGKLAARTKGTEERMNDIDTECPICFLQYSAINKTRCCQAYLCTECYLQVRNPKESSTPCPFCNQKLTVVVAHISDEAARERKAEEQRVIEAQIKASASLHQSTTAAAAVDGKTELAEQAPGSSLPPLSAKPRNTEFGASLEQNERVARLRKLSSGESGKDLSFDSSSRESVVEHLKAVAMTPAERQALEAEMKAQHHHPLAQRMQQEEAERRFRNEMEYLNSPQYQQRQQQEQRLRDLHARRLLLGRSGGGSTHRTTRDWNRIVEAFESGTAGNAVHSLDDLVVLEAAIMLSSMEQSSAAARGRGNRGGRDANGDGTTQNGDGNDDEDDDDDDENEDDFAARHARAGFPLARARVAGGSSGSSSASALAESLLSRSSGRSSRGSGGGGASHRPWLMAALMSEEEQLAMAIAASLADVPPPSTTTTTTTTQSDDNDNTNNDSNNNNDSNSNNNSEEAESNGAASGNSSSEAATAAAASSSSSSSALPTGNADLASTTPAESALLENGHVRSENSEVLGEVEDPNPSIIDTSSSSRSVTEYGSTAAASEPANSSTAAVSQPPESAKSPRTELLPSPNTTMEPLLLDAVTSATSTVSLANNDANEAEEDNNGTMTAISANSATTTTATTTTATTTTTTNA
ncbi:hypothetical protein ACA910_003893 [Epithemia clementina (nom. ined.)]